MKYIIEIEDEPFERNDDPVIPHGMDELYRAKGFNALVFDKDGLDKLTPLDKALEEAYQKGLKDGKKAFDLLDAERDSEYQRGLEDGKARNEDGCVGCRYDNGTIEHSPCDYCCNAYSNQWTAKLCSDEIKVGDEIESDDGKRACVLYPGGRTARGDDNMTQKPPLGLKPRWLHEKQRIEEICDAMERYAQTRIPVPVEWIAELRDLLKKSQRGVTE